MDLAFPGPPSAEGPSERVCSHRKGKKRTAKRMLCRGCPRPTSCLWPCVTSEQMRQRITWKPEGRACATVIVTDAATRVPAPRWPDAPARGAPGRRDWHGRGGPTRGLGVRMGPCLGARLLEVAEAAMNRSSEPGRRKGALASCDLRLFLACCLLGCQWEGQEEASWLGATGRGGERRLCRGPCGGGEAPGTPPPAYSVHLCGCLSPWPGPAQPQAPSQVAKPLSLRWCWHPPQGVGRASSGAWGRGDAVSSPRQHCLGDIPSLPPTSSVTLGT